MCIFMYMCVYIYTYICVCIFVYKYLATHTHTHTHTCIWQFRCGEQKCPQEKQIQEGKVVVWESLTNSWEKKRSEGEGERERYT